MKKVLVSVAQENYLWYGIGEYYGMHILSDGIGKFSSRPVNKESTARYKKYAILTPDINLALKGAVDASLKDKERIQLILCKVSNKLMETLDNGIIKDFPVIKGKETNGNKVLATFISDEVNDGVDKKHYTFYQVEGNSKWKKYLVSAGRENGLDITIGRLPESKTIYIPPSKEEHSLQNKPNYSKTNNIEYTEAVNT